MDGLDIQHVDRTLVMTIDRGQDNLFTSEMIAGMADAVTEAARDGDTSFVHLRARGPAFCLGRERVPGSADEVRAESGRIVSLFETLRTTPLVVLTEVQGDAAGLGVGLVEAADVALAAEEARFRFPEIDLGYAPTVVISWARYTLPAKQAFDMVVSGRPIDAATAQRFGLLTEVLPSERLEARAEEWLKELRGRDPRALRDVKSFFAQTRSLDPASAARASVDPLSLGVLRLRST